MVEHNLSVVENLSDTITVLARGEILAEGDYRTVARNPDVVQAYMGSRAVPEPLLEVRDLHAWYGESHILHGVDFEIRAGEMVTLLGRNGAGKTSTLKSIMGIVSRRSGSVRAEGRELIRLPSNEIARLGLAFCPEERGIFASLTVEENLFLPPVVRPGGLGVDAIYELFPNLRERLHAGGMTLSGGEQQMLAIGRILRLVPDCSCSTSPPRGWPRSSSSRSARRCGGSRRRDSPSSWSSRTFALPPPSPTVTTSWNMAGSST